MHYIIEPVENGYIFTTVSSPCLDEDGEDPETKKVFEEKDLIKEWCDKKSEFEKIAVHEESELKQRTLQELFQYITYEECVNNKYDPTELTINIIKKSEEELG